VRELPVEFPAKCVYCGEPQDTTRPFGVKQVLRRRGEFETFKLKRLQIPYCEEHAAELRRFEQRTDRIVNPLMYVTLAISAVVGLWLLYQPIYRWAYEGLERQIGFLAPVAAFLFAAAVVGTVALVVAAVISIAAHWLLKLIWRPPVGMKTSAYAGWVKFKFKDEAVAEEFKKLNRDLGAREFSLLSS